MAWEAVNAARRSGGRGRRRGGGTAPAKTYRKQRPGEGIRRHDAALRAAGISPRGWDAPKPIANAKAVAAAQRITSGRSTFNREVMSILGVRPRRTGVGT